MSEPTWPAGLAGAGEISTKGGAPPVLPKGIDGKEMDFLVANETARASCAGRGTMTKSALGGTTAGGADDEWLDADLLVSMAATGGQESELATSTANAAALLAHMLRSRWLRQLWEMKKGCSSAAWKEAREWQVKVRIYELVELKVTKGFC